MPFTAISTDSIKTGYHALIVQLKMMDNRTLGSKHKTGTAIPNSSGPRSTCCDEYRQRYKEPNLLQPGCPGRLTEVQ